MGGNNMRKKISLGHFCVFFIVCLVLATYILFSENEADAATIRVPQDYPNIQAAIDNASTGDTINVAAGTYYETIKLKNGTILKGAGAQTTIIDGSQDYGFVVEARYVVSATLEDFTIANGSDSGMAILHDSEVVVANCIFVNNRGNYGAAMKIYQSSPTITNCIFCNNRDDSNANGGIEVIQSPSTTITNCIVWNNEGGDLIIGDADVNYCCYDFSTPEGAGNIDTDPMFVDSDNWDFHLQPDSPCIDRGTNNAPSMPDTDFEGDPRPVNGDQAGDAFADMGVDEYCTYYNLSTAVSSIGMGTITLDPPGGIYAMGTTVTITASANPGYTFSHWSGQAIGTDPSIPITMNANKIITANFTELLPGSYTLSTSVYPPGAGSITLSPSGGVYEMGEIVTVTATANSGNKFVNWGGDNNGTNPSIPIYMDSNKSITAYFLISAENFPVNYTINEHAVDGVIYYTWEDYSIQDCILVEAFSFPNPGYSFNKWYAPAGLNNLGSNEYNQSFRFYTCKNVVYSVTAIFTKNETDSKNETEFLYVGGSRPNNYTKIQDAIDDAEDGYTVYIYAGTYYENVVVNKTIDLIGENTDTTIIDGGGNNPCLTLIPQKETSIMRIEDLNFTNGYADEGGGINIAYVGEYQYTLHVSSCSFWNNTAAYGGGIYCRYYSISLINCHFQKNKALNAGAGIFNYENSQLYSYLQHLLHR